MASKLSKRSMITLYLLEESRADRIVWALDILKLKYRLEIFRRDPTTKLADPALKKIHPSGKSPLIKDGDRVVAESGVIIDYLVQTYGKDSVLAPKNEDEKWAIEYGLVASESNFMISFMQLYINSMARKRLPWGLSFLGNKILDGIESAYARPELYKNLDSLQNTIESNGGYFCGGHLSGADLMYLFNVIAVRKVGLVPDFETKYPGLAKWSKTVKQEVDAAKQSDSAVETIRHEYNQQKL